MTVRESGTFVEGPSISFRLRLRPVPLPTKQSSAGRKVTVKGEGG
jgi:hypothetical protein